MESRNIFAVDNKHSVTKEVISLKKKIAVFWLAFTLLIVPLAGCTEQPGGGSVSESAPVGSSESGSAASPQSSESAAPAEITGDITYFTWAQNADTNYPQVMLDEFKKKYPGINVTFELGSTNSVEEYLQVQKVKLLAGDKIDVTSLRTESRPEYVAAGYLLQLDGQPFLENYNKAYLDIVAVDGKTYCIPYTLDISGVLYNKNMFAEKGWAVPTNIDEYNQLLDAIKAEGMSIMNGGKDAWTMQHDVFQILHKLTVGDPQIFEKVDRGEVKYTDEVFLNALKEVDEFYKKGYIGKEVLSITYDQSATYFMQGKTPLINHAEWILGAMRTEDMVEPFEIGVFPIPHNAPGEKQVAAVAIGVANAVTSFSKNQEAALALLDYMSSVEAGMIFDECMGNFCPVSGVISDRTAAWEEMFKLDAVPFFYSLQYPGANAEMLKGMQMMFLGQTTPEQLAADIQAVQDRK